MSHFSLAAHNCAVLIFVAVARALPKRKSCQHFPLSQFLAKHPNILLLYIVHLDAHKLYISPFNTHTYTHSQSNMGEKTNYFLTKKFHHSNVYTLAMLSLRHCVHKGLTVCATMAGICGPYRLGGGGVLCDRESGAYLNALLRVQLTNAKKGSSRHNQVPGE